MSGLPLTYQPRMDLPRLQGERGEAAQQPQPTDRGVEEVRLLVTRTGNGLARGQQQVEGEHPIAEAADAPVVLAVRVGRRGAAHRDGAGAGHDRRPPAVWQDALPELDDGHPWLDSDPPGLGIPVQHPIERGAVEDGLPLIERRIAVATASAAQTQRAASVGDLGKDAGERPDVVWAPDLALRFVAHAPAFKGLAARVEP